MKNHLNRIAVPKTWTIDRTSHQFTIRPKSSGHSFEQGLPLGLLLRDFLKLAPTMGEIKKLLNNQEILVDGRRRTDHRYLVGLFDVLTIPLLKESYRLELNGRNQLLLQKITAEESKFKLGKIVGKMVVAGGKVQLRFHDGKNVLAPKNIVNIGDTAVLELPSLKISRLLACQPGATVFLTKGKHVGDVGHLKEVRGQEAIYLANKQEIKTLKNYLFVIGEKEALIQLGHDHKKLKLKNN